MVPAERHTMTKFRKSQGHSPGARAAALCASRTKLERTNSRIFAWLKPNGQRMARPGAEKQIQRAGACQNRKSRATFSGHASVSIFRAAAGASGFVPDQHAF